MRIISRSTAAMLGTLIMSGGVALAQAPEPFEPGEEYPQPQPQPQAPDVDVDVDVHTPVQPVQPAQPQPGYVQPAAPPPVVLGEEEDMWRDRSLRSGIGISAAIGGGIGGFTEQAMRDTTSDIQGLWNLRVTLGTRTPIGLDLNYLGSASNIDSQLGPATGTLVGTALEGALRLNILPREAFNPYIFAGLGWQRYDVTEVDLNLSDAGIADSDNLLIVPMGAGLSYRMNGFVADLRGTFRAAAYERLVLKDPFVVSTSTDDFVSMHTWEATATIGAEF
jgi:hypothetical protein